MEASIPGKSIKLFSHMVKCLGKVGEELYLEAYPDKVLLKTLNANRSAYFSFCLVPAFFEALHLTGPRCTYKILLKPFQAAFRTLQNVERCLLGIIEEEAKLVLEMHCKLGVKKTFKLNIEDGNPISASYSKEEALHRLIVRPKLLEDCIANFASNVLEMSMKLSRAAVNMKSSEENMEEASDPTKKLLLTELTLDVKDFEKYELEPGSDPFELVFSLRDVRPILQFCELATVPIQIYMNGPGQPIVLSVKMYNLFEADFVLATLQGTTNNSTQSSQASTTGTQHHQQHQQSSQYRSHSGSAMPSQSVHGSATPHQRSTPVGHNSYGHSGHHQAMHSHDHSQSSMMGSQGATPHQHIGHGQTPHSFQFDQSAPTPHRGGNHMAVDPQADAAMGSAGLWAEDVLNRKSNRMDDGEDDEAVHSDDE